MSEGMWLLTIGVAFVVCVGVLISLVVNTPARDEIDDVTLARELEDYRMSLDARRKRRAEREDA